MTVRVSEWPEPRHWLIPCTEADPRKLHPAEAEWLVTHGFYGVLPARTRREPHTMYIAWVGKRDGVAYTSITTATTPDAALEAAVSTVYEYADSYRRFLGTELVVLVSRGPYTSRVAAGADITL